MVAALFPDNEKSRIEALNGYDILDSLPEKAYDDITSLASIICSTPIALVSIVDSDRQWFKSKIGLDVSETPRELAFCAHAILNPNKPLIVEDATKDSRFFDNDLVTSGPKIRFYAGCSLITPTGQSLGTLCAIDSQPRKLSEHQVNALQILANNIVNLLELRKAHAQSATYISDLKQSNSDLETFAYVAAHDLKSPLRAIDNLSSWMQEDLTELDEVNKDRMQIIRGRINRMEGLLDSLLTYSQVGRIVPSEESINVNQLIKEITALLNVEPGFEIIADESLRKVNLLRTPLEQVFLNLISNALKHHDEIAGNVRVSCKDLDDFYEFSVTDDGPGIPEQYNEQVFELFQTLKPRDKCEGSGMGLAIVKKIVLRQGGKVTLKSTNGNGTIFAFTWPK